MKIGLVRHCKVRQAFPSKIFVGYDEVLKWFDDYEIADIEHQNIDLGNVQWDKCYSSSAPRALRTAERIFSQDIIKRDDLKELNCLPLMNKTTKLPFIFWGILIGNKSMSANQLTNDLTAKLSAFVDELMATDGKNVLIVSHGFVMLYLQKELIKRGFTGNKFRNPANAKIYVFEN